MEFEKQSFRFQFKQKMNYSIFWGENFNFFKDKKNLVLLNKLGFSKILQSQISVQKNHRNHILFFAQKSLKIQFFPIKNHRNHIFYIFFFRL